MTRLIQKAGVKCHTEKREKRDGWVNRLVSFLSGYFKRGLPNGKTSFFTRLATLSYPLFDSCGLCKFAAYAASR